MDVMFEFADTEKFLNYYPGKKLNIGLKEGLSIPQQSGLRRAITSGRFLNTDVATEVYEFSFKSTMVPLKDAQSKVQGVLTMGISLEN